MSITAPRILILPGWQGSGPDHWQSHWERLHGYTRVEQNDWQRPLRGDWNIQLEEAVLADERPVVLVAHSLGCIHVAAWASHSRNTQRVRAALLVAPPDVERPELRGPLPGWSPIPRQPLPFASLVLYSDNDPYASPDHARQLAVHWGSQLMGVGALGHINADSALADWPAGHALLQNLLTP